LFTFFNYIQLSKFAIFIAEELSMYSKKLIFIISIAAVLFTSCNSTTKIQDGETAYLLKKYTLSAELLQKNYAKAKDITLQSKIALKIADSYDKQLNFAAALPWYKKIADARVLEDAVVLYLNALKRNEKYKEAYTYLEDYLKANKSEKFRIADIVGVKGGKISKITDGAEQFMVISLKPIVLGNTPENGRAHEYEKVAAAQHQ